MTRYLLHRAADADALASVLAHLPDTQQVVAITLDANLNRGYIVVTERKLG